MLGAIVTFGSIMTALTAKAVGVDSFLIIRFLFGMGEAGAFPTATRAMQLWFTREERGLAQGVTHSASRLGRSSCHRSRWSSSQFLAGDGCFTFSAPLASSGLCSGT